MFLPTAGGCLGAALSREDLVKTEVDAWLADLGQLAEAGLFTNCVVAFTASGEKAA
jgi:hypothetical protein